MDPELMNLEEIAELAGVKRRAVTEWVSKGLLTPKEYFKRPGMKGAAISLFARADVDDLLRDRTAEKTQLVPVSAPGPVVRRTITEVNPRREPRPVRQVPPLPIDRKTFLNIEEAVEYTGIGKAYIRENITGWAIGPRRSLVYRRTDLDKL